MNIYFLAAGSCAALLLLWQLTIGRKQVLVPLKNSELDPMVKTLLQCSYHYQSVMLLLSAAVLTACAFDVIASMQGFGMVLFIGMACGIFAIWQLYISFVSDLKTPFIKVNHWLLYLTISALSVLGAITA